MTADTKIVKRLSPSQVQEYITDLESQVLSLEYIKKAALDYLLVDCYDRMSEGNDVTDARQVLDALLAEDIAEALNKVNGDGGK